jgi:hypothetical protein
VPARIKTSRISSVAYATDDSGSDANTARPTGLLSRSWRACASGIGGPTNHRFINAIRMPSTVRNIRVAPAETRNFLRVFYVAYANLVAVLMRMARTLGSRRLWYVRHTIAAYAGSVG